LLDPDGLVLELIASSSHGKVDPWPDSHVPPEHAVRSFHSVSAALESYERTARLFTDQLAAVGYSNGANIAASMLLLRPEALPTAILFRAMVPLSPETHPNLSSARAWIGAGTSDPIIPMSETKALAELLCNAGADVTIRYFQAGHELTMADVESAREWLMTLE
jgi:phospholipase/carboxylesterase